MKFISINIEDVLRGILRGHDAFSRDYDFQ